MSDFEPIGGPMRMVNPRTEQPVSFDGMPTTDKQVEEVFDFPDYMMKQAACMLYNCRRQLGETIEEAFMNVMEKLAGGTPPPPQDRRAAAKLIESAYKGEGE